MGNRDGERKASTLIRLILSVILMLLGAGTGFLMVGAGRMFSLAGQPTTTGEQRLQSEEGVDVSLPNPDLSPRDVVLQQVIAWRTGSKDPEALIGLYSFASPDNRSITGPFERFCEMVLSPPFGELAGADNWQVGEAVKDGQFATVLVSCRNAESLLAFRFYLRKQQEAPYEGCWMTDTVEPQVLADFPAAVGQEE